LGRYDHQQIADAAEWKGDAGVFVSALLKHGFLDMKREKIHIHDWFDFCGDLIIKRLRRKDDKRRKTADNGGQYPPNFAELPPTNPTNPTQPNPTKTILCETAKTPHDPPRGAFELVWAKYPSRTGRKAAERHFKLSVKTMTDFLDIQRALDNYKKSDRVRNGYIQNGSTWFNNWRDWTTFVEEKHGTNDGPRTTDYTALARAKREAEKNGNDATPRAVPTGVGNLPDVSVKTGAGER
jgi:hypothetical protein